MTLVADLFGLQEIDSAIDQRLARLEDVRAQYGENEALAELRAEIVGHAAGIPELEARQRELDLQVATLREKAEPVETKLYDGSVTNPKELGDLQRDLEMIGRQREGVEEELLGILEQLESKRGGVRQGEARLSEMEAAWSGNQESLHSEEGRLEADVEALRGRRAAQAERIPSSPVHTYDRLRQRRKGVAVVKVERGACLGCRLTVPVSVLQRARSGMNPNPVQCPSCERMLYVI